MRNNTKIVLMSVLLASGMTAAGAQAQIRNPATTSQTNAAHEDTMVGKQVLGKSRELLGTITGVDRQRGTANMKAPGGATIPVPLHKLTMEEDHLRAASISRGDVIALIRETGQSGVFEVSDKTKTPVKPAK